VGDARRAFSYQWLSGAGSSVCIFIPTWIPAGLSHSLPAVRPGREMAGVSVPAVACVARLLQGAPGPDIRLRARRILPLSTR
jgi:hypothetical protein